MIRKQGRARLWQGVGVFLLGLPLLASAPISDIADRILHGGKEERLEAVKEFNALPAEAQYSLVPNFEEGKKDPDPEVRKIASRILKVMGKRSGSEPEPDTRALQAKPEKPIAEEKWSVERKMKAAEEDQWAELKKMRAEEEADYAALQKELINEKKKQVKLDPIELLSELRKIPKPQ